ncbi:hypothetical protein PVAP13_3KG449905, partial [Panicum virgatum]
MAHSLFGFDLNVRLEDDDDGDIPLDSNEHEADDGNASFDLNEPVHDEHGNGFNLNLPLDEFGAVDFDYVQNLADHADQVNQRKHDYSDNVRQQVYQALLMRSKSGRLGKHDSTIVGDQFGVKIRTVQRIWQQ